jgi:hypothetical protein
VTAPAEPTSNPAIATIAKHSPREVIALSLRPELRAFAAIQARVYCGEGAWNISFLRQLLAGRCCTSRRRLPTQQPRARLSASEGVLGASTAERRSSGDELLKRVSPFVLLAGASQDAHVVSLGMRGRSRCALRLR